MTDTVLRFVLTRLLPAAILFMAAAGLWRWLAHAPH